MVTNCWKIIIIVLLFITNKINPYPHITMREAAALPVVPCWRQLPCVKKLQIKSWTISIQKKTELAITFGGLVIHVSLNLTILPGARPLIYERHSSKFMTV